MPYAAGSSPEEFLGGYISGKQASDPQFIGGDILGRAKRRDDGEQKDLYSVLSNRQEDLEPWRAPPGVRWTTSHRLNPKLGLSCGAGYGAGNRVSTRLGLWRVKSRL